MPAVFLASIALLALFGVDSWRDWWEQKKPDFFRKWREKIEQRRDDGLRSEGVLKPDGTVEVDVEFDGELNALNAEVDDALSDLAKELDALEAAQ
jgi:hypothetical protein